MGNFSQFDAKNVYLQIEDMILDDHFGKEEKPTKKLLENGESDAFAKPPRSDAVPLNNPELFIGEYYSEDLETTYIISLEGNKLILKNKNIHRRITNEILVYIGDNQFLASFWKWKVVIKFVKDADVISGFQIVNVGENITPHEFVKIK